MWRIWSWFMYDVYTHPYLKYKVLKIPNDPKSTSISDEKESYELYKKYLWDNVAETEFIDKGNWDFEVIQELVKWKPIDLADSINKDVFEILEKWNNMQEKHKIFFDIFWLEWMIILFNYYYKDTYLKKISDFSLSIASFYLERVHKLPKWKLKELNERTWNPFVANNILRNENGVIKIVDTDNRPLNILNPLNLLWNWITKKALKDIKRI